MKTMGAKRGDIIAIKTANDIGKRELNRLQKESTELIKREGKQFFRINDNPMLKQRMIQLYVSGYYTKPQICSILKITRNTLNKLLKQEDVIDAINEYQDIEKKEVETRLRALRNKATDVIDELMDSDDDAIRLQASKDVLDRTGIKEEVNKNINVNVSYEQQLKQLQEGIDFSIIDID